MKKRGIVILMEERGERKREPREKRHPWVGGVGMVLFFFGACAACRKDLAGPGGALPYIVMVVGLLMLAYAMLTGNVTLFG